jgi:hypothetical protein
MLTRRAFRTEDIQILSSSAQNVGKAATWHPGLVHSCLEMLQIRVNYVMWQTASYEEVQKWFSPFSPVFFCASIHRINPLTSNDPYKGRTAPLTSKVAFYIFIQQI